MDSYICAHKCWSTSKNLYASVLHKHQETRCRERVKEAMQPEEKMLYTHMQMHNDDTITTSGHSSLEKYTSHFIIAVSISYDDNHYIKGISHFIERIVCERELETEQNCNILTPTLLAITAFLSRSPGLLNRGPVGPAPAGTWFSFQHLLSNYSELPVSGVI